MAFIIALILLALDMKLVNAADSAKSCQEEKFATCVEGISWGTPLNDPNILMFSGDAEEPKVQEEIRLPGREPVISGEAPMENCIKDYVGHISKKHQAGDSRPDGAEIILRDVVSVGTDLMKMREMYAYPAQQFCVLLSDRKLVGFIKRLPEMTGDQLMLVRADLRQKYGNPTEDEGKLHGTKTYKFNSSAGLEVMLIPGTYGPHVRYLHLPTLKKVQEEVKSKMASSEKKGKSKKLNSIKGIVEGL